MGKNLRPQRRGKGGPNYRSPSFRHLAPASHPEIVKGQATVRDIVHAPGRTTPLALLSSDGHDHYVIAAEGAYVQQQIEIGEGAQPERGNILPLGEIPEGTMIFNIEIRPGDGGKLVRAAGTAASVISHGAETTIQLPSGQFKRLDNRCRATVGVTAGGGRIDKPFAKAGKKYHAMSSIARSYLKVSGVAMNPVNHPFGGGSHQHVGRPSTVSRNARPGQKVGRLSPKRKKE